MPSEQEEHLERAREVWQTYQFYIYVGLGMILATIAGFTLSHSSFEHERDDANLLLYRLMSSADDAARDEAVALYEEMLADGDYAELDYLGGFVLASLHFSNGEYGEAEAVLQPALERSEDSGIRLLAALRIAEVRLADGEAAAAVELLQEHKPREGSFIVLFEERIGDAEFTAGNIAKAAAAYVRALRQAQEQSLNVYLPVLNIKLSALLADVETARQARLEEAAAVAEFEKSLLEEAQQAEDENDEKNPDNEDNENVQ